MRKIKYKFINTWKWLRLKRAISKSVLPLTIYRSYDIVMAEKEKGNPYRCVKNHFCKEEYNNKNCPHDKKSFNDSRREELIKKYSSDPGKDLESKDYLPQKVAMTKQEWALWYKAIAENKKLGYWAEELPNGEAIFRVENDGFHKIVITSGTFENPKAKSIFEFDNSDDLIDFIEILKEKR